jgi:ferrous iron transport protein B
MTGVRTIASNYPGTTVAYTKGKMRFDEKICTIVDAPGTYSLEPFDEAARVTIDLIDDAERIINVVDATHLERHLPFTLELLAQGKPLILALNMSDEAHLQGIHIDTDRLAEKLGIPVVPITARSGEGVRTLIKHTFDLPAGEQVESDETCHPGHHPHIPHQTHNGRSRDHTHLDRDKIWQQVGGLVDEVQTITSPRRTIGQYLEEMSVHPVWGTVIAMIVVAFSFSLIRIIGEFLISGGIGIVGEPWVELPFGTEKLFNQVLFPLYGQLSQLLGPGSLLHDLLLGPLIDGSIDFEQSFGILTSGLFIPLGVVLPYLISFYFVLSLLEDSGYLPRLAVFLDNFMHRLGLHGYAVIPMLLGLGCNVPGIMATRILESRRQRFITVTLISIAIPCAALQAMIIGLVGSYGLVPVVSVYGILFIVWVIISIILRFTSREFRPELLIEIPPYRLPTFRAIVSKMWLRMTGFIQEALPIIMVTILAVNILYQLEVLRFVTEVVKPVITTLWGMPEESIFPLLVGILRKDVALGMFAPLELSLKQLITGSVLLAMFFPCIATLVVLFRELGLKDGLKSLGVMLVTVFITGSILNLVL